MSGLRKALSGALSWQIEHDEDLTDAEVIEADEHKKDLALAYVLVLVYDSSTFIH